MKIHKSYFLLTLTVLIACWRPSLGQSVSTKFPLVPYPQKLVEGKGMFTGNARTVIILPANGHYAQEAELLNELLLKKLKITAKSSGNTDNCIRFIEDPTIVTNEGYQLQITPSFVNIKAKNGAGIFHAIETIRQLLPASVDDRAQVSPAQWILPAVTIDDAPVYAWRGMHLDVSRHFFSIAYLKKFIDLLALYKFNKFHLHLTDDQGWRIEIKKYPKLTSEGAWRTFNNQDSVYMKKAAENPDMAIDPKHIIKKGGKTLYGGFYTQAQMKDVVAYALARHIDIIPEIDMPGHMMAAINSYPFLTCNGENKWGELFTKPICPCNESTFEFAQNIFDEIMQIFPSEYIHIGGDEVDRTDWGRSEECKAFMEKEGIKDLAALQSYFIDRMEKYFNSKGRKLIGWDEILEGGISPTALVMYWRTWVPKAPVEAAKNGNQVIMSPGSPLYFDTPPDRNSLENVYNFDPIPKGLNATERKGIIGAQANLWTEYVPTENRADYMYMPRMTALAENLWSAQHDLTSYQQRLQVHYKRLDGLHVNYRLPDLDGLVEQSVFTDKAVLQVKPPLPGTVIRYTLDGSLPKSTSPVLSKPITITRSLYIRLAAFRPNGGPGDIYNLHYTQQAMAQPAQNNGVKAGLHCEYYPGAYKRTTLLAQAKPQASFNVDSLVVPKEVSSPSFGLKYQGYLDIPQDGIYSFYLTCDDGGVLKIAGRTVVDNDGWHGPIEKSGQVAVKKGLQPLQLDFVEGGGGYTLKLRYSVNGSAPATVPASWFKQ
ncbi:family 20 glycosylhydrolase [Mucilaginibacter daejeonensis]|uniref:family 20 glycosylhydrolase n=1 Tax=Mucilaginibacter daejeonensis TaxID=398049 RepID=UPI001D173562|nr:family 20 glycosylhydrolase [Mucilaginibacter daejeonensis]UEG54085.1 family 20 glycosylhydrolase [Mucilaginibacter daejeonensis]